MICHILFFGLAPAQTYDDGFFDGTGTTKGINYTQIEIFLSIILACISYLTIILVFRVELKETTHRIRGISDSLDTKLLIIALFAGAAYIILNGGLGNVLSPRSLKNDESGNLISPLFLASTVCALAYVLRSGQIHGWRMLNILLAAAAAVILAICVNPFNAPRFFILASWGPVIASLFKRNIKIVPAYLLFLTGAFIIAPVLSSTTRLGAGVVENDSIFTKQMLRIKDADAFEVLTHTLVYVSRFGHSNGDNFLSVTGFYIPRAIWTSKPQVGGLLVGDDLYSNAAAGTPNLSFPLAADAYMDFGVIAVSVYALFFAILIRSFRSKKITGNTISISDIILACSLPILLRGPLGAVIGYPLCLMIISFILSRIYEEKE